MGVGLTCARTPHVLGMSENITIYTTPHCQGCALTQRRLDKAGIEYEAIDLSKRPDLIEQFKNEGLLTAPIIETRDGDRSSGFNPDRIRQIIALADPYTKPHANNAGNAGNTSNAGNSTPDISPAQQDTTNTHRQGRGL